MLQLKYNDLPQHKDQFLFFTGFLAVVVAVIYKVAGRIFVFPMQRVLEDLEDILAFNLFLRPSSLHTNETINFK